MESSNISSTAPLLNQLNLPALNGVRCLACLSIIALHVNYVFGSMFLLSTDERLVKLREVPIIGPGILNLSLHMTIFWIISGFLCEYQLQKLQASSGQLRWKDYCVFLLNRLLRLYPLYLLVSLLIFASASRTRENFPSVPVCTTQAFVESLLFVLHPDPAPTCVGIGWSVMVDVHGYLAIVTLFAQLSSRNKRILLPLWYVCSILYMIYSEMQVPGIDKWNNIPTRGWFGLENMYDYELLLVEGESNLNVRSLFYPDKDFFTAALVEKRRVREALGLSTYFTSILKHGSAMMLGSWLCLNLLQQESQGGKRKHNLVKIVVMVAVLHATEYDYKYTGIVAYLLLDIVLTLDPKQSPVANVIIKFLSSPFWKKMAPYTYGIYMSHLFVLAIQSVPVYLERADRFQAQGVDVQELANEYTLIYILKRVISAWLWSWLVAFVLHYTIEWPFNYLRKRRLTRNGAFSHAPEKNT